ncbi:ABC transporter substrate-binding protein [Leifsonia kafniensis]|uniref:ABC transporter substrate-binding protein n=1 Tax=Leifsonia kafniensis TaxID=475957 RepID=A0ABP7KFS9_9MICO
MRVRLMLPVLAATAALVLTGCVDNSAPAAESGTNSAATEVDSAAVALLPASIAKAGVLRIGTDAQSAPNEYKDADGNPTGWGIELAEGIAGKLGLTTEYKVALFDSIIPSIVGGQLDMGMSSFTDTVEREKVVSFVNHYTAGIQWASQDGTDVDPNNACGLKVAVQSNTVQDTEEIPAKSDACVAAGQAAIEKVRFDTQDAAVNAVVLGQADAWTADSPVALYAIAQTKGKLIPAGKTFDEAPYGIATAKGTGMAEAVQAALQSMIDDGSYDTILDSWGVADGGLNSITIDAAANG